MLHVLDVAQVAAIALQREARGVTDDVDAALLVPHPAHRHGQAHHAVRRRELQVRQVLASEQG